MYNTDIPAKILKPDKVETRIGTLELFYGSPTDETAERVYDNLDHLKGDCRHEGSRRILSNLK
jgi:hypothetical protein